MAHCFGKVNCGIQCARVRKCLPGNVGWRADIDTSPKEHYCTDPWAFTYSGESCILWASSTRKRATERDNAARD